MDKIVVSTAFGHVKIESVNQKITHSGFCQEELFYYRKYFKV